MAVSPAVPHDRDHIPPGRGILLAHVQVVLLAPSPRQYHPRVDFLELVHRDTQRRLQADVDSDDAWVVLDLEPGRYDVTRIRIQEGPYAALADVQATVALPPDTIMDAGTWRIGIDTPKVQRMLIVSFVAETEEAERFFRAAYPAMPDRPFTSVLPDPGVQEARLYEVTPYPRVRYYQRHWW